MTFKDALVIVYPLRQMSTNTPSPHALKAAEALDHEYAISIDDIRDQSPHIAAIIQQAIDAAVAERTRELRDVCKLALEYFEGPPFVALHGDTPAKKARNALKP